MFVLESDCHRRRKLLKRIGTHDLLVEVRAIQALDVDCDSLSSVPCHVILSAFLFRNNNCYLIMYSPLASRLPPPLRTQLAPTH